MPLRLRLPTRTLLAVALATCVLTTLPGPLSASVGQGTTAEDVHEQLGEVTKAEAAAVLRLLETQARAAELELGLVAIGRQVAVAQAKVDQIEAELAALRKKIDVTRYKLAVARDLLDRSASGAYLTTQSGTAYDRIFATRPKDLASGKKYLSIISHGRSGLVDDIEALERTLKRQEGGVVLRLNAAGQERTRLTNLRAVQQQSIDAIAAQAKIEEAQVFELAARRVEFERQLGVLQASSDSIAMLLPARGNTAGPGNGKCEARPVPGEVTSGFGPRVHPIYGTVRQHNGLDMTAASGEPIAACRTGVVVIASTQGGYGNAVVIDHGGGMATLYAHQSRLNVRVGQSVEAGDTVGFVGSTGLSTGPHLHFEVRLSGSPVDGAMYL